MSNCIISETLIRLAAEENAVYRAVCESIERRLGEVAVLLLECNPSDPERLHREAEDLINQRTKFLGQVSEYRLAKVTVAK